MSKKCAPLWREAHFQIKMHKAHHSQTTIFGIQMSKKCTPLWREAQFQVKMCKAHHPRTAFGSCDVKSARRCGAKHVSKSNRENTPTSDHFWQMSKKCTPFWREAHVQVQMYKTHQCRTTFGSSSKKRTPL